MKPELILQADILDIIFEGRNKDYGAYELRREYNTRMKKALYSVIGIVIALFTFTSFNFLSVNKPGAIENIPAPDILLKSIEVKMPDLPKPTELPKIRQATIKNTTPLIVNEDEIPPLPEIKKLAEDVLIGTETIEGPRGEILAPPAKGFGAVDDHFVPIDKPKQKVEILPHSEIMPEFPGGQAAFMRFLSKNLRVPEGSLEAGQQVKVFVRFVVGKEGELSNMEFIQATGEVFEHEVARVMRKMPKWKPGSQNGENVSVYFTLPIIFQKPEE
jgi:protein TonB